MHYFIYALPAALIFLAIILLAAPSNEDKPVKRIAVKEPMRSEPSNVITRRRYNF